MLQDNNPNPIAGQQNSGKFLTGQAGHMSLIQLIMFHLPKTRLKAASRRNKSEVTIVAFCDGPMLMPLGRRLQIVGD